MSGRGVVTAALLVSLLPGLAIATPASRGTSKPKPARQAVAPVEARVQPPRTAPVLHLVQRGETLGGLARQYGVTVASVVIANRLKGPRARLQPGQSLKIPRPGSAPPLLRARRTGPVDEPLPVSLVLAVPDFEDTAPAFRWPVAGVVSSTFGRRRHSWHRGLDIQAEPGAAIVAAAAGVVVASGFEPRYGLMVKIEHEGGFMTVYAHNERNLVEAGEQVAAGQVIATVGRTGRATAEHLHFEIRYDGRVYNPLYLLPLPPRTVQVVLTDDEQEHDE
jgi:murein DD-endopeptidase MepM/ murein hydrolase activator NlpD